MKPKPAPSYWPYLTHRTMAEVIHDERMDAFWRRPRPEKGKTFQEWRKAG